MKSREEDKGSGGQRPRLPDPDELVPLTQALIPLGLASAFKIVPNMKPGNGSKVNGNGLSNSNSLDFPLGQAQCQRALGGVIDMNPENGPCNNIDISPQSQIPRTQRALEGNPSFKPENGSSNSIEISPQSQSQSQRGLSFLPSIGTNHHLKIAPMLPLYEEDNTHTLASNRKPEHNGYMVGGITDINSENGLSNNPLKATFEDGDSCGVHYENPNEDPDPDPSGSAARTLKRPRLVWTPQLHKRFVDAVAHLGIKGAVPKTIMQLMNVEGLTRENVASHLQKYRLYLKRMQGLPSDIIGSSSVSDQLFASTPVPPGLVGSTHFLSNNGDDVMMPLVMPMPMSIPMPMAMGGMYDHNVYTTTNGVIRPSSSQKIFSGDKPYLMDGHGHSPSPQKQVLTLFPN